MKHQEVIDACREILREGGEEYETVSLPWMVNPENGNKLYFDLYLEQIAFQIMRNEKEFASKEEVLMHYREDAWLVSQCKERGIRLYPVPWWTSKEVLREHMQRAYDKNPPELAVHATAHNFLLLNPLPYRDPDLLSSLQQN